MSKEMNFIIYCVELYKNNKQISGRQAIDLFNAKNVCEYLREYYEALHTTGPTYIINDIDEFIDSKTAV